MASSVSYPIAKDENGRWVNISEAQRGDDYFCPECSSPFVVKLGSIRAHHFSHRPGYSGVCVGESGYYHLAKHLLAYHYERERQIPLLAKCPTCARVFGENKKIIKIEVEKGSSDYRPDVRLILEGNVVIDCEVVFKNPLGDKFSRYREKRTNLLIWEITGQVHKVPPIIQYYWEEDSEYSYFYKEHKFRDKLLLLASPIPPQHVCTPHGVAYIFEVICWKCNRKTKVALISSWFPLWGDSDKLSSGVFPYDGGSIDHYSYIPINMIPRGFWAKLNSKHGTNLREDFSKTASQKYLMNHCHVCHVKIGDWHLRDTILEMLASNEGSVGEPVMIQFELTKWEERALAGRSLKSTSSGINQ